jgi:hypothetical protein
MLFIYWAKIYRLKKSTEALSDVTKETGLQVNDDKTVCLLNGM